MDYSLFRSRAEVDWIEIEVSTVDRTNHQTVRRRIAERLGETPFTNSIHAEPLNKSSGGAASIFCITIQNPQCFGDALGVIDAVSDCLPLAAPPLVTGIEVSIDAYAKKDKGATQADLVELVAHFYRGLTRPASDNRRFAGRWKGDTKGVNIWLDRVKRDIADGRVIVIGDRDAPISQRIYFKTTDKGGKVTLPEDRRRARIEITLQGAVVSELLGKDLRRLSFEKLSKYFKFRTPDLDKINNLNKMIRHSVENRSVNGERKPRKMRDGSTRLYDTSTCADTKLNKRASDALRELSRRWFDTRPLSSTCLCKKDWRRGNLREIEQEKSPQPRMSAAKQEVSSNNYIYGSTTADSMYTNNIRNITAEDNTLAIVAATITNSTSATTESVMVPQEPEPDEMEPDEETQRLYELMTIDE